MIIESTQNNSESFFKSIKSAEDGDIIQLEPTEYNFYPENAYEGEFYPSNNDGGIRKVAMYIKNKKNVTIDGKGARLIFHGMISPIIIENSTNIILKNFTIDFAHPFLYQAVVVSSTDKELELNIDKDMFPYTVRDKNVIWHTFSGDVETPGIYVFDYDNDSSTGRKKYIMTSMAIGKFADAHKDSEWTHSPANGMDYPQFLLLDAYEKENGNLLLKYRSNSSSLYYPEGSRLVLMVNNTGRTADNLFVDRSKDIAFENITIHRGPAMGIIAQCTQNISVKNFQIRGNEKRGDLITTTADSMMFVDCKGDIKINDCYVSDSLDDGLNVHSTYVQVKSVNKNKVIAGLMHSQQKGYNPFIAGDKAAFTNKETMEITGTANVISSVISADKQLLEIIFDEPIPESVKVGNVIENISAQPNVEVMNTEYCRSTAILIGTSGKVRFINNKINTRVGSIRIKDDPSNWYESGRTADLLIENNTFYHCGEWSAECLIEILTRCSQLSVPFAPIHKNIRIINNKFIGINKELLCANYVDGLTFSKNRYYSDRKATSDSNNVVINSGNCINCLITDNEINPS